MYIVVIAAAFTLPKPLDVFQGIVGGFALGILIARLQERKDKNQ